MAGGSALLDTLQWSADGNTIYAANNENATGDLYVLDVSPSGVALASGGDYRGIFTIPNLFIHLDPATGLLYGDDGLQVDPTVPKVNADALANGIAPRLRILAQKTWGSTPFAPGYASWAPAAARATGPLAP